MLRHKFLQDLSGSVPQESWAWSAGIVLDCMEEANGYLMFEVMFEAEIGWWDDYELKLIDIETKQRGE